MQIKITAIQSSAAALLVGLATLPANASISIDPVNGVFVSSQWVNRDGDHLVNGSGLTAGQHNTNPDGFMWHTANEVAGAWVVFDLGAVYQVNSIDVWNHNSSIGVNETRRGINALTVQYGNALYGSTNTATANTVAGITNFAEATGLATYTGQNFNAFTPFTAQFIAFEIDSNHAGDNFVGLSEVQFNGTLVSASTAPTEIAATVAGFSSEFGGRPASASVGATNTVGFGSNGLNALGHHSTAVSQMWLSNAEVAPDITYDLGAVTAIGQMQVWNYNETAGGGLTSRGAREVDIYTSDNNVDFTLLDSVEFNEATGADDEDFSQLIDLNTTARYIKLDVQTNWGASTYTGLSEVKFFAPIPEPSSLAVLGLSGLLVARRRRG